MRKLQVTAVIFALLCLEPAVAQHLKPGFSKSEYIELMKLSAQFGDSTYRSKIPVPPAYTLAYRSEVMGLDNRWDLWISQEKVAVVSLRGTTEKSESWLANFYAAMVPAEGALKISDDYTFDYKLADHPKAAVHVGWLVSTAFLASDILPKIDSCYQSGIKDVIILGHSQGGAIAYLLTAHLYYLQKQNKLPADLRLKTYCSAAPKPGNLYFAYDYETLIQNGWGYNVVNSADWVPEVPVTVQTLDDFNQPNPFVNAKETIKKQKFRDRIALNYAYKKLYKPTKTAQKNYQKILGKLTSKKVSSILPGFEAPDYYNSNHYVRTGPTIVLMADEDYFAWNPMDENNIFAHHFHPSYLYLAEKLNFNSSFQEMPPAADELSGAWELDYITGIRIAFEGLYPEAKPQISFDFSHHEINGNTSCNTFSAAFTLEGQQVKVASPHAMTKVWCEGEGEKRFLNMLQKIEKYAVREDTLRFYLDNIEMMRFSKVK